jgi:uracil-DNA glycosylase
MELAQKRKRSRWNGYKCIGDYHGGDFECDYVSPYTKSAHNVDSNIMIILQDWSSDEEMSDPRDQEAMKKYGYTPSLGTNKNLIRLLNAHFGVGLNDIYATNLFPFIKPGALNAPIHRKDLVRAAQEFALPQVKIVCPKLVVCIGQNTFNAIRRSCDYEGWPKRDLAIESPFKVDRSRIWCQAHTAQLAQNTRGVNRVSSDWKRMKDAVYPSL